MKKSLLLVAGVSIIRLCAISAFADDTPTTCSLATLHTTFARGFAATRWGAPYSVARISRALLVQ